MTDVINGRDQDRQICFSCLASTRCEVKPLGVARADGVQGGGATDFNQWTEAEMKVRRVAYGSCLENKKL